MKGKSTNTTKTRTTMSNTNLSMLIDFYIGDMQRRGCSSDAMITNKRARCFAWECMTRRPGCDWTS